ncbi:MAG TPA: HNH endonuclease, partial [Mycobacterium sp.]|nr:HNH endonuclease [Mycobacterium sp.]
MAHGSRRRSHRSPGAAAGITGPATASSLHSVEIYPRVENYARVETHPPGRHEAASIWSRRRVLLLNSTYEPLTALPMRRAIVMVICGKADVVHHDPAGPVIHSATSSIVVPSVIQLR